VACQALWIVGGVLADDILVGIVACNATDARVRAVEAFAIRQTVGLEADGQLAAPVIADYGLPGAMTLAAKIRDVLRRPFSEIGWSGIEIAVERIAEVGGCASMAMLAGHAGPQGFVSHFSVRNRVAGVATETDFGFAEFDLASDRLFEIAGF
jgi:hypothetical protein